MSPHNVVGRSDDLELIEVNLPAEFGIFELVAAGSCDCKGRPVNTATSRPPPGALAGWLRTRGGALAIFALLFVAWEVAVRVTGVKEYLLPTPSKVWTEF